MSKASPYRWVVLGAFMSINLTIQVLWISYAPITGPAAAYYGVTDLAIGALAMSFMIAFIPLSLPVSWAIDTWGFRPAVSIGAVLMGVFGVVRGLAGSSYPLVLVGTIGVAAAQPFLLNAWTKMPALWFPAGERATAVGLITLANLAGTAAGMVLTPLLLESMTIPAIQTIYAGAAAVTTVVFLVLARERPTTPVGPPGEETRALVLDGLRSALRSRSFLIYLGISFVGIGVFNGVSTWVEGIVRPRGFTPTDAGLAGALLLVGGVAGAVLIPALSDRSGYRRRYIVLGLLLTLPGLLGLTYATSRWLLFVSAAVMGFFLVSTAPVGMQYAAEITRPTPEGTSNGLIQLVGQASVVFVYVMEAMKDGRGAFTAALLAAAGLLLAGALAASRLVEPPRPRS